MSRRLFCFEHKNSLAIRVLEIEKHSQGSNPYVMVMARFHEHCWRYEPGVTGETVHMHRANPTNFFPFYHLHHPRHTWARMDIQCAAHRLIISDDSDVTST